MNRGRNFSDQLPCLFQPRIGFRLGRIRPAQRGRAFLHLRDGFRDQGLGILGRGGRPLRQSGDFVGYPRKIGHGVLLKIGGVVSDPAGFQQLVHGAR